MPPGRVALWTRVKHPSALSSLFALYGLFGCHTEQETSFDYLAKDIAPLPKEFGQGLLVKRHSQSAAFKTPAD